MIVVEYIRPGEVYGLARRLGDVRRAYFFVRDRIRYITDMDDHWQTPRETLEKMEGDCEDKAFLLASLLKAMGRDAWVRYARVKWPSGEGDHAYVLLREGASWIELDPACSNCPFGRTGFYSAKPIMDFNDRVIIIHNSILARKYIVR